MEQKILYRFVKMDLTQFAFFHDGYKDEDAQLDILNRFQFAYNFGSHTVLCKTIIEVSKNDSVLMKSELDSLFEIEAESAKNIESDDVAVVPPGLLAQFASLAYSSMRGALYFKMQDTPLCNFILPPSDVTEIITSPQRFLRAV